MKKYAVLLLLVLGLSSTAWGFCKVDVCVDPVSCGEPVVANVEVCCSGQWTSAAPLRRTVCGNIIYLDVYLKCTNPCGSMCSGPRSIDLPATTKCGLYTVVVRVWMEYSACGWPYCTFGQSMLVGMGSTYYKVRCDDCGYFPCRCAFQWPSWPWYPCPPDPCPPYSCPR